MQYLNRFVRRFWKREPVRTTTDFILQPFSQSFGDGGMYAAWHPRTQYVQLLGCCCCCCCCCSRVSIGAFQATQREVFGSRAFRLNRRLETGGITSSYIRCTGVGAKSGETNNSSFVGQRLSNGISNSRFVRHRPPPIAQHASTTVVAARTRFVGSNDAYPVTCAVLRLAAPRIAIKRQRRRG